MTLSTRKSIAVTIQGRTKVYPNITAAADVCGISRPTLYKRLNDPFDTRIMYHEPSALEPTLPAPSVPQPRVVRILHNGTEYNATADGVLTYAETGNLVTNLTGIETMRIVLSAFTTKANDTRDPKHPPEWYVPVINSARLQPNYYHVDNWEWALTPAHREAVLYAQQMTPEVMTNTLKHPLVFINPDTKRAEHYANAKVAGEAHNVAPYKVREWAHDTENANWMFLHEFQRCMDITYQEKLAKRRVIIGDKTYKNMADAVRYSGVPRATLYGRLRSPKHPEYQCGLITKDEAKPERQYTRTPRPRDIDNKYRPCSMRIVNTNRVTGEITEHVFNYPSAKEMEPHYVKANNLKELLAFLKDPEYLNVWFTDTPKLPK